jgi:hypothetical protein
MRVVCWLAALGLGLAACGGSSGDGSQAATIGRSRVTNAAGSSPDAEGSPVSVVASAPPATGTQPATLSKDVCSLLSDEQVQAALQIDEIADGGEQPGLLEGGKACQWESTNMPPAQARIEIAPGDPAAHKALLDASVDMQDAKPVEGVGERAQWTALTGQLDVLEGPYLVSVQVLSPSLDAAETTDAAKHLALAVIAELD